MIWLGYLASKPQGCFCLRLPITEITSAGCYTQLFTRLLGIELRSSHFGGQHFTNRTIFQARLLSDPAGSFLSGSALDSPTQQSPQMRLCVLSGTVCLAEGFFGSGRRTVPAGGKQASAVPPDISRSSGEKGLKPQPGTGGVAVLTATEMGQ